MSAAPSPAGLAAPGRPGLQDLAARPQAGARGHCRWPPGWGSGCGCGGTQRTLPGRGAPRARHGSLGGGTWIASGRRGRDPGPPPAHPPTPDLAPGLRPAPSPSGAPPKPAGRAPSEGSGCCPAPVRVTSEPADGRLPELEPTFLALGYPAPGPHRRWLAASAPQTPEAATLNGPAGGRGPHLTIPK